jgi:hypothetical protein
METSKHFAIEDNWPGMAWVPGAPWVWAALEQSRQEQFMNGLAEIESMKIIPLSQKKAPSLMFTIIIVSSWALAIFDVISVEALYYIGFFAMCIMSFMAKFTIFPFGPDNTIKSRSVWFVMGLFSFCVVNPMFAFEKMLFWYPTESLIWAFLPFLIPAYFLRNYY